MALTDQQTYFAELRNLTDRVFRSHPEIPDHRDRYPWLTGFLGDPFSGIWFLAENPSLSRVENAVNRDPQSVGEESQWSISPGDKLFRTMLRKHGFKQGEALASGGWNCYITDVIKETDYVQRWRNKSQKARFEVADIWAPVLHWELANSRPKLIVVMGRQTQKLLDHLRESKGPGLPHLEYLDHYSFLGSRPQGKLGPMHPKRIEQYDCDFARIAEVFREISG